MNTSYTVRPGQRPPPVRSGGGGKLLLGVLLLLGGGGVAVYMTMAERSSKEEVGPTQSATSVSAPLEPTATAVPEPIEALSAHEILNAINSTGGTAFMTTEAVVPSGGGGLAGQAVDRSKMQVRLEDLRKQLEEGKKSHALLKEKYKAQEAELVSKAIECAQLGVRAEKVDSLMKELAETQGKLRTAEMELEAARTDPAVRLEGMLARSRSLASQDDAQQLLDEIADFRTAHAGDPKLKGADDLIRSVERWKAEFRKAQDEKKSLEAVGAFAQLLKDVRDGDSIAPAVTTDLPARFVKEKYTLETLKGLPTVEHRVAVKDAPDYRGRVMKVEIEVHQIERVNTPDDSILYQGNGLLAGTNDQVVRFVTSGSTEGIFEGSKATFWGVFTQVWWMKALDGKQYRSVVLVGFFEPVG